MTDKVPPEVDPDECSNKFSEYFQFISVLGSGAFGVVVAAQDKKNEKAIYAVKVILTFTKIKPTSLFLRTFRS